jgi:beta-xylosidase
MASKRMALTSTGNAIHSLSQLNLRKTSTLIIPIDEDDSLMATGGLYAPTIRYQDGTFYIVCTNVIRVDNGPDEMQNFIISTTDIYANKWSNPVYFDFNGIDPSLFFDKDEKAYICGSAHPGPGTRIALFQVNPATGEKLGEEKDVWTGTGGIYPEGPHIYSRGVYYYLLIAEGGTHEGHSVTMARSKDIWGPYESCPNNPVLSASGTAEYVQCTGHCEAFEDVNGEWWGVCLAVRMAGEKRYGLGRETFRTRAKWNDDGWLEFDPVRSTPMGFDAKKKGSKLAVDPGVDFLWIRDHNPERYSFSDSGTSFRLIASPVDLSDFEDSPTFLGKRQRQLNGSSGVTITNIRELDSHPHVQCGLAIYKDEHRFLRLYYADSSVNFELVNGARNVRQSSQSMLDTIPGTLRLEIEYTEIGYKFRFSGDGGEMQSMGEADTMDLSEKDFVGPIVGMFAVNEEDTEVCFEDFDVL